MVSECPPNIDSASEIFSNEGKLSYKIESYIQVRKKSDIVSYFSEKEVKSKGDFVSKKSLEHVDYYLYDDLISIELPKELIPLKDSFKKSEYILSLENDWDDEGADPYDKQTWKDAILFVHEYAINLLKDFNKKIQMPKIYHGPSKSIDILMENDRYTLLFNIEHGTSKANYFGKDHNGNTVKGEVNLHSKNYSLIPLAFNF